MVVDSVLLDIGDRIENANTVKNMVLDELVNSDKISSELYKEYKENWHVIIVKPSWFKKLIGKDASEYRYEFVKFALSDKHDV